MFEVIKKAYGKESKNFLILCSVILLFILFFLEGTFFSKIIMFTVLSLMGGLAGYFYAYNDSKDPKILARSFKKGAGGLLIIVTIITWGTDGKTSGKYESPSSGSSYSSSKSHTCSQCGKNYSGIGWSTIGGEQYQPKSDPGYDIYCSKKCAFDSQPLKWKLSE